MSTRNVVGKPVLGDDFINRERELVDLRRHAEMGNHVLVTAPRRIGKTSILKRLASEVRDREQLSVYVDASGLSEMELVTEIATELDAQDSTLLKRASDPIRGFFKRLKSVGLFGLSAELESRSIPTWQEVGDAVFDAARSKPGVVVVDEISVFVMALLRSGDRERARDFLLWFKRQREGTLQWILSGSIGLDTVLSRAKLSSTVSDLYAYDGVGSFDRDAADHLLEQLGLSDNMLLAAETRARICDRIGWLSPYYIQLLFCTLREGYQPGSPEPGPEEVDAAYERLLAPARAVHFAPWLERLGDQLGHPDDDWAIDLLDAIAAAPDGLDRGTLEQALASEIADAEPRQDVLGFLLRILENDGYLAPDGVRYRFRSPLLRDVWRKRFEG